MAFECRIAHSMPGRLRVGVSPFPFTDLKWKNALEAFLQKTPGLLKVRINQYCQSIALTYHPAQLSESEVVRIIENLSLEHLKTSAVLDTSSNSKEDGFSSYLPLILSSAAIGFGVFFDFALTPILLLGASIPIYKRALSSISEKGRLNVDVLDASAIAVLSLQQQFNTATFMVWLISLGNFIRDATIHHSQRAIEELFDGVDQAVWVVRGGEKIQIGIKAVEVGDEVVVYPGERIPVDGVILSGRATVDQKILTGESMPLEKKRGHQVYSGTVVREGKLYLRAQKVGAETMKAKIIQLLNNAPVRETRMQDYAEHFADRIVPWSFLAAGLSFALTRNINTTSSLLIIDYGTGMRIAAPTTVLSSLAKAAHQGILVKGGRYLETLAKVNTVVFDKTGTLTKGEPEVEQIISYRKDMSPGQILSLAAAAEVRLTHPVAEAIVQAAKERKLTIPKREASEYTIGLGIEATIGGSEVLVGCNRFMALKKVKIGRARRDISRINSQAAAPLFIALDGKLIGLLIYTDPIRPEAYGVLQALREKGVGNIIMLTGDHPAIAKKVAETLGIDQYFADVFPEEKAEIVTSLQARGNIVAVIGDGINDTPALIQADVGIAVKGGADVAIETAHVSLLEGGLWKIPQVFDMARESMGIIQQNWAINFYPNSLAIAMALLNLIGPINTTLISNGSAIMSSFNALRPLWSSRTKVTISAP